jgi:hypothetical protein
MTELDPFRAVISAISSSDSLTTAANSAGLAFDMALTKEEGYSHGTRLRVLIPRLLTVYEGLDQDRKGAAAQAAMAALDRSTRETAQRAKDALAKIGWEWDGNNLSTADGSLREKFFPKGTRYDAAVAIRQILNEAHSDLLISDGYCDESLFHLLAGCQNLTKLNVRVLCSQWPGRVAAEAKIFMSQHKGVTVGVRSVQGTFHDRFILIDGASVVHCGASIKDAGGKGFMLNRVELEANRVSLITEMEAGWAAGPVVL